MIINKYHYLDNASTTQKPKRVIKALTNFYTQSYSNTHRGLYELSVKATDMYANARENIANFIGANTEEIVFTRNATESINLLARCLKYETVLVTEMEHHSNFVPWQQLSDIKIVKFDLKKGELEDIAKKSKDVDIVTFTHMSNVTGQINDVKRIVKDIRKINKNCTIIVDGCQAVSHMKVDVKELDVDFYCFSSHKMYGPTGIGILYGKKRLLSKLSPFFYGGNMVKSVGLDKTEFANTPQKFEAGTYDAAGVIGLSEAVNFLKEDFELKIKKEKKLLEYLLKKFKKEKIQYIGHEKDNFGPIVSFNMNVDVHDFSLFCDLNKVCIRVGHHCAEPFIKALGVNSTARASLSFYNTKKDIDALVKTIVEVRKKNVRS